MKSKPVRQYLGRIFMAGIVAFVIPSAFAVTGYNTGISAGFSYSNDNFAFLASYGNWTNLAPYGQVWAPTHGPGWRPFLNGQWIWTTDGWAWSSDEPYGWLVYHYGNWNYQPDIGWYWIPGDNWSPATVVWSSFGDYVCWAPAPPVGVYWPQPWFASPFGFNIWIGVTLGNFTRHDLDRVRIHRFPDRDQIRREHVFSGPPNIVLAQRFSDRPIITHRIDRGYGFYRERGGAYYAPQPRPYQTFPQYQYQRGFQRWRTVPNDRVYRERRNSANVEPNTPWGSPPMPLSSPPQPLGHIDHRDVQHNGDSQSHQGHFEGGQSHPEGHGNAGHGDGGGHSERGRH